MKAAFLAVLVASGCTNPESGSQQLQVLVCIQDGKVTYRSSPAVTWNMSDGGAWSSTWGGQKYKQSLYESCHTEIVSETAR